MDVHTPEQRSRNMRAIKSKDTKAELLLRKELWKRGYRYFKNYKKLPGKPDIAFTRAKLAIFVDGEFWHGYNWSANKKRIKTRRRFWIKKIERNMERDREVNSLLEDMGWTVLRFWNRDIFKNTENCIKEIEDILK